MNNPLVSIIIPTFNRSSYLKKAILSALKQKYSNIEVIVVDDFSSDDTPLIVKEFNDSRLKYLRNEKNKGGPYSRNLGFKKSKGEFINFLDDDDTLHENKILLQIEKFQKNKNSNLGVVTCDLKFFMKGNKSIQKNRKKGYIYKDLLKSNCVFGTHSMLIKRIYLEEIGAFDLNLKSNQEYDLMIRLSKICTFDYVPIILCSVYESINQITFNFDKKLDGTRYLYKKYKTEFKKEKVYFYSFLRFTYLEIRYQIGKYLGFKIYNLLP